MFSLLFFSFKGINQPIFSKQNTAKATVSKGVPMQSTKKPDLQKNPNIEFREGKTLPTSHPLRAKGKIPSCAMPSSFFTTTSGTLHRLRRIQETTMCLEERCRKLQVSLGWGIITLDPHSPGCSLDPKRTITGAVRHASLLLLKLEEDGPSCPVPSIPV